MPPVHQSPAPQVIDFRDDPLGSDVGRICLLMTVNTDAEVPANRMKAFDLLSSTSQALTLAHCSRVQMNRLLAVSEMHSAMEIARRRILRACEFYQSTIERGEATDLYEYFSRYTSMAQEPLH